MNEKLRWKQSRWLLLAGGISIILVVSPLAMAFILKFVLGMEYKKAGLGIFLCLLLTTFGNGFFEEVLWRGLYMKMFPNNNFIESYGQVSGLQSGIMHRGQFLQTQI